MKYNVYWYDFRDYKGEGIKSLGPKYHGILYKVGHQWGTDEYQRIRENRDREGNTAWVKLWGSITCEGMKVFDTKEEAIEFENMVHKALGPKRFLIKEKVSGVSEFRIANKANQELLNKIFNK